MKRLLLVDDDPQALNALGRQFLHQSETWEVVLARGGRAAMTAMTAQPADLVVSDLNMPDVDGLTLMRWIQERHPATTRILLSAESSRELLLSTISVTHQFLAKPCHPKTIRTVVERSLHLQQLLQSEPLRAAMGRLDALPPAPRTYLAITAAMLDPNTDLTEISDIVEQDPSLSAKLLQLVNSAYFGLPQPTSSTRQAVGYLGLEQLKGAALAAYVFGHLPPTIHGFSFDELQKQSAISAQIARQLLVQPALREEAFTAAIVHDIGLIALAAGMRKSFQEIVSSSRRTGTSLRACVEASTGVSHAAIGAYLLGTWGLPLSIVEAVAFHLQPRSAGPDAQPVVAAVHAADVAVDRATAGTNAPADIDLDMELLDRAGIRTTSDALTALARAYLSQGQDPEHPPHPTGGSRKRTE